MIKWNIPNILTMTRIAITPAVIALFLVSIPNGVGVFVALGLYILACLTDLLDGKIARKYNMVTDFGKFMDQIADKAITTSAMILVLLGATVVENWLAILMVLVVVLRDIIISGVRMVAANKNVVIAADIFGKIKSFFLDIASMVLMLFIGLCQCLQDVKSVEFIKYVGLGLMGVGVLFCLISLINYIVKAIEGFKKLESKNE